MNSGVLEHFWHGIIEGFQGAPGTMEEIGTSGVQIAARWHTGHGAHIATVKGGRVCCQSEKVGCVGPITAIVFQHMPVEAVEHNNNGAHDS